MHGYYSNRESGEQFRHEYKYLIEEMGRFELAKRLSVTMDRDQNSDKNGEYHVRSLYFDDLAESSVLSKMSGVMNRKKYRIRIYNIEDSKIILECKEKSNSYVYKRSVRIDVEAAEMLIQGIALPWGMQTSAPVREFCNMITMRALRPVLVVDYYREAFVAPFQTVRITFDTHLSSSSDVEGFFDKNLPTMPVFEKGNSILEIKFNDFLPSYYRDLISGTPGQRSALSKYILSRNFSL